MKTEINYAFPGSKLDIEKMKLEEALREEFGALDSKWLVTAMKEFTLCDKNGTQIYFTYNPDVTDPNRVFGFIRGFIKARQRAGLL